MGNLRPLTRQKTLKRPKKLSDTTILAAVIARKLFEFTQVPQDGIKFEVAEIEANGIDYIVSLNIEKK